jgi:hypothetical protein
LFSPFLRFLIFLVFSLCPGKQKNLKILKMRRVCGDEGNVPSYSKQMTDNLLAGMPLARGPESEKTRAGRRN